MAAALPVICSAQNLESSPELTGDKNNASTNETAKITDRHNFVVISDRDVVWQKVYNSDVKTIHDLEELFFGHGFTDCQTLNDSTLVCRYVCPGGIPYKRYGYSRMKLPLSVLSVRDLEARVVVQLKDGKYRITFDNISTCNGSAGIKNGYTDFFIENITGELYDKRQLSIPMAKKYCYLFSEGNADMRELLGGKGANLAEMTGMGLPVPQGFTISTEACTQYYEDGRKINEGIMAEINEYITKMEEITGKKFGDKENPLLVSVRSGARASMPGMMDTILNLGLNEDVVNVIAEKSNNPRWAWDCYRRFIQMYSDVVMEVGKKYFEELIDQMKAKKGVTQDVELTADDLKELASQFKAEYKSKIGTDFPTDPKEQLMGAVMAVFRSWDNPRANVYRRDNDIPYSWGTAVNVQSMAFGNMGDDCGTGVAFTRDPATGEKHLMGEFLMNAQGEDVVAGIS